MGEGACVTESLEIDDALLISIRNADPKHARIIVKMQAVNELAV